MLRRRSSAHSSSAGPCGFTLSEVLIGLSISSILVLGVGTGFVFVTKAWIEHQARAQAQQSLRGAIEAITREMRIAGACMPVSTLPPVTTAFQPLTGTHGTNDTITITANPQCAGPTNLPADVAAGATTITVDNSTNFQAGMRAYIYNSSNQTTPPGPYGEFFSIQSVAAGSPGTLTATAGLGNAYPHYDTSVNPPRGSTVWGADQRTFAISSTCGGCNGVPTLTLQANGGPVSPLVKGIDQMTIQYVLNRTYASNPSWCDAQTGGTLSLCVVNLPATGNSQPGDWQLVRASLFTLDARSVIPVRGSASADGFMHLSESFEISPRNFVFQQTRVNWTPY